MGVIRRQGMYSALFTYSGFVVGAFNLFFLYTFILTPEQFGLTRALMAVGAVLMQFAMMATFSMMYKFFPYYKDYLKKDESDFAFMSLVVPFFGFVMITLGMLLFKDFFVLKFSEHSPLLVKYYYYIIPFTFSFLYFTIFKTHLNIRLNAAFPTFLEDLGYKFYSIIIVLLYYINVISFDVFMMLFCTYYFVGLIPMFLKLRREGDFHIVPKLSKVSRRLGKKILSYGGFIYAGLIIGELAEYLAPIMISGMEGLKNTGILSIAIYLVAILQVPQKAMFGVTISVMSDAWKRKDIRTIETLYKKTALNMLLAGLLIFVAIWVSIDEILALLPPAYMEAKPVVLLLSLAKLFDLACGMNGELLNTSNFWKFNFGTQVLLLIILIPVNYLFISNYGILGTGYAALVSQFIYNGVRFWFIYYKFKLQPFTLDIVKGVFVAGLLYTLVYFVPGFTGTKIENIISICLRSGLFATLFLIAIIYFRISEDIAQFSTQIMRRIKGMMGR
ncbi:MAG: hypothetical protein SGJ10_14525 [Bacteroidota bacterium]|nr:hypothetical protein [Bacteroidota bacterium]